MKQEDLPNLSILLSRGKETNKDSPSNGEWSGKSSTWKSVKYHAPSSCGLETFSQRVTRV